jgi:hypothetical protein
MRDHRSPALWQSALLAATAITLWIPAPVTGQTTLTAEQQIAAAVLAAPPDRQAGARVLGFGPGGSMIELRGGANDLICLADDPTREGFSVACYHESMDPFMARGRELSAQGITDGGERNRIRWEEADAGRLSVPDHPASLYVLTGESYDPASGEIEERYLRYVIYVPWATPESLGLPDRPTAPGAPWLMFPGTASAHIMISPPLMGG